MSSERDIQQSAGSTGRQADDAQSGREEEHASSPVADASSREENNAGADNTASALTATTACSETELARRIGDKLREAAENGAAASGLKGAPMEEWDLATQGQVSEEEILDAYAAATGIPVAEEEMLEDAEAVADVSHDYLSHNGCLPLHANGDKAMLAVYHPYNLGSIAYQWTAMFQQTPEFVLTRRSLIEHALTNIYASESAEQAAVDWTGDTSEQALKDLAHEAPVVRLVNDMFNRAVEMEASDIHVEPSENELAIRYRIDGILHTVMNPPLSYYAAIASRLKLIANLNIAERRLPQDGRIDLKVGRHQIDVRVSTIPSMHGESIVLRLLQKDISLFDINTLGIPEDNRESFRKLVLRPYGMLLVVGPTGSGKTTTLYSVMRLLNSESQKIVTIEDPVEYQVPGLTQIQVRPQIGLTFADGLRSIVRQDPDIILVGEIRDRETAEIAIHAALTGHLVFSTLHTNDAAGAISRLLEMDIEAFLISSALLGVLSQRLVRQICPDCNGEPLEADNGRSCRTCNGTGYRGRTGIFELLEVNDELRHAINERRDSNEIARIGRRHGMRTLREDGDDKVRRGMTTQAEVSRVCQLEVEG